MGLKTFNKKPPKSDIQYWTAASDTLIDRIFFFTCLHSLSRQTWAHHPKSAYLVGAMFAVVVVSDLVIVQVLYFQSPQLPVPRRASLQILVKAAILTRQHPLIVLPTPMFSSLLWCHHNRALFTLWKQKAALTSAYLPSLSLASYASEIFCVMIPAKWKSSSAL